MTHIPARCPLSSHVIFRSWSDSEAELVRGLLESYGIPCQVISHITHSVVPLTVDGLGEIRLSVPDEAADEAREILEAHQLSGVPRNLEIVGE
ncbi:MAG TPA: DUF2007 domain-containing protein [Candidatus Polarisedimenticolia bacterium]|nr:DUF2007 domain-containing protein [Candidatus Polarisedimenticolia bacterium]